MRCHVSSERTCVNPKSQASSAKRTQNVRAVKQEAEESDYVYFCLWNFSASVA